MIVSCNTNGKCVKNNIFKDIFGCELNDDNYVRQTYFRDTLHKDGKTPAIKR